MLVAPIRKEPIMLKYIPGLVGAALAMTVFRFTTMIDPLWIRFVVFGAVYIGVTILVDKAMTNYGKP
jgi:hypothetical protein